MNPSPRPIVPIEEAHPGPGTAAVLSPWPEASSRVGSGDGDPGPVPGMVPGTGQGPAPDPGEIVPSPEVGTPSQAPSPVGSGGSDQALERWKVIQGEFVDDPRKSVQDAHELVGEVMAKILEAYTKERERLQGQWSGPEQVSTEDLRNCLQRYRAFLSRLLPAVTEGETHPS